MIWRAHEEEEEGVSPDDPPSVGTWILSGAVRLLLLGLLWVLLSGADPSYTGYGVVSVAAAAGLSLAVAPPRYRAHPRSWFRRGVSGVRLAVWFLGKTVHGGADVAVRALRRRPNIAPQVVAAPFALPAGRGRQLALMMMNLMPGTMVQRVREDPAQHGDPALVVELHTLSDALDPADQWRRLQELVAPVLDDAPPGS